MQLPVLRNRHVFLADLVCFVLTPLAALALRVDFFDLWGSNYHSGIILYILVSAPLKSLVFYHRGLYRRFWRYASTHDAWAIVYAVAISATLLLLSVFLLQASTDLASLTIPRSLPLIDGFLTLLAAGFVRFSIRGRFEQVRNASQAQQKRTPALIVGAGHAGSSLARELQHNPSSTLQAIGFVDDDPAKKGMSILGLEILGSRHDLAALIREHSVQEVVIAMPTASGKIIREVLEVCTQAGVISRTLPSIHEIASGQVELESLRPVSVEDLLRRAPVETDLAAVCESVRGKTVLVSGGGGSIGSELCRQLLGFRPARLLVLGHGENSVFETVAELRERLGGMVKDFVDIQLVTEITPIIADTRSRRRVGAVMREWRPDVVFHAAAHKHVPLMEMYPCEAVTTNVLGTQNLLNASEEIDVSHFVYISSDKAVRPTSVMGATKRVAEFLVQTAAQRTGKNYQTVRFGNVLGSRGSVILTFQRQIATGGPVTVTHPDVMRYFMTIPEAVELVLQASVLGTGGEVFVLDMGEPIKIIDLARDMIRLSGLREAVDIDLEITGLRDGEKMFENLFQEGETHVRSEHEKIFAVQNADAAVPADLDARVASLVEACKLNDDALVVQRLVGIVPEFRPTRDEPSPSTARASEPAAFVTNES